MNPSLRSRQSVLLAFALSGFGLLSIPPVVAQSPVGSAASVAPRFENTTDSTFEEQGYVLGPGDQIQINVYGYDEYTGAKTILPDGTITLSLIGPVRAAGLTTEQFTQALTARLDQFLVDPVVTVELGQLRPVVVTVSGEVRRPGPLQLDTAESAGGSRSPLKTLNEALMAAGGVTQDADIRQVTLTRATPNGGTESIVVDLWAAIASPDAPSAVILQEGDSIYVPRLSADAQIDRRLLSRSSYAPETVRVRVVGEVTNPGEVAVPPDSTLSSAVAIAGGPTEDARLSRVAYIRLNEEGRVERETIDLRDLTDSYQVQDGDVIIVPKRTDASVLDIAGRVVGPLGAILSIFRGW
jgi:polysaccharide export outer membrane protein